METDERVKALQVEMVNTKDELSQLLLDIRTFIMDIQNPMKQYGSKSTNSAQGETNNGN